MTRSVIWSVREVLHSQEIILGFDLSEQEVLATIVTGAMRMRNVQAMKNILLGFD